MVDFESYHSFDGGLLKVKKKKPEMTFVKNWLSLDAFLILLAFMKMLNQDELKMSAFFSELLNDFSPGDQLEAKRIMEEVYCAINNKLLNYLNLHHSTEDFEKV